MTASLLDTIQLEAVIASARQCRLFAGKNDDGTLIEASFLGYKAEPLDNWALDDGQAWHSAVTFTFAGGMRQKVLGSYITDAHGSAIFPPETFAKPFDMKVNGDYLEIMPRMAFKD